VDFVSEFEYDLFIRPDTCNPRYRIWFNFVVDNVRADQRVIFNLVNLSKTKNLFSKGMTPLVKTSSRPKWYMPRSRMSRPRWCRDENWRNSILQAEIGCQVCLLPQVSRASEPLHPLLCICIWSGRRCLPICIFIPILLFPSRDAPLLGSTKESPVDHFPDSRTLHCKRKLYFLVIKPCITQLLVISESGQQTRKVQACTICNPAILTKKPKVVVLMARSHPGESPTSYVAQG